MVPPVMSLGKLLADLNSDSPTGSARPVERRAPLKSIGNAETGRFLDNLGDRVRIKLVDQVGTATSESDLSQEELRRLGHKRHPRLRSD